MSEQWNARGKRIVVVIKKGAEATANGLHSVSVVVARQETSLADGAQAVTVGISSALRATGQAASEAGRQVSKALHPNANHSAEAVRDAITGGSNVGALRKGAGLLGWAATKLAVHALGLVADATTLAGNATAAAGRLAENSAPVIGGVAGGVIRGAAEVASNAVDAAAISESSIESMRDRLKVLGQAQRENSEDRLTARICQIASTQGRTA